MIEVECPQCEAILEVADSYAGQVISCPECAANVPVPVPASAQVIEVHAEKIDDDEDAVLYEGDPFFNPNEQQPMGGDKVWGRNIHFERAGSGGSGCCAGGCLLIALLVFFTIYGVISFFAG